MLLTTALPRWHCARKIFSYFFCIWPRSPSWSWTAPTSWCLDIILFIDIISMTFKCQHRIWAVWVRNMGPRLPWHCAIPEHLCLQRPAAFHGVSQNDGRPDLFIFLDHSESFPQSSVCRLLNHQSAVSPWLVPFKMRRREKVQAPNPATSYKLRCKTEAKQEAKERNKFAVWTNLKNRKKFRSQTSDNMGSWKSRGGQSQRGEEKKWEDQRRERVRRKKMQVREKVGKSRFTALFPIICGSGGFEK